MATLTPALDERPPGPASVARFGVILGRTVENARWGTAARRNADNIVKTFKLTRCESASARDDAREPGEEQTLRLEVSPALPACKTDATIY